MTLSFPILAEGFLLLDLFVVAFMAFIHHMPMVYGETPHLSPFTLPRRSGWNRLDLVIVAAAIADLCVYYMFPTVIRIVHVFRVERLLRTLRLGRMLEVFQTVKVRGGIMQM